VAWEVCIRIPIFYVKTKTAFSTKAVFLLFLFVTLDGSIFGMYFDLIYGYTEAKFHFTNLDGFCRARDHP